MRRIERSCDTPELTEALASAVGDLLVPGDRVAMVGGLGAGKTTFVRGLSRALGVDESMVSSPTFVVVNQYPCRSPRLGPGVELVHADLYRLTCAEDLDAVGWDHLTHGRSIVVAEWPDRAHGALGREGSFAEIELVPAGETSRIVRISVPEAWAGRPAWGLLEQRAPTLCRVTGRAVSPTAGSYPFFDDRARLADLGAWFGERYKVSRSIREDDLEDDGKSGGPANV